jgi:hypothetical protein
MIRKIIKNLHQFRVNIPVELVRKLKWNENTVVRFHEVDTSLGKCMLIAKDETIGKLKVDIKNG